MHKKQLRPILLLLCLVLLFLPVSTAAEVISGDNTDTGYTYILDDSADFLDDSEKQKLESQLADLTAYCNVAFVTTDSHTKETTEDFAADYFDDAFGAHASGTLLVIDRCLNEVFLYSDGAARRTVTDSYAYSITDNTYVYATKSHNYDYYTCANKTFAQVQTLMEGRWIAEPMRYICSALLAVILALFLNFFIVMFNSRSRKADEQEILSGVYTKVKLRNPDAQFVRQSRTYSPRSSGSSSSGSSSHSSSSGGGGGHSGGGGGGHSGGGGGHAI